MAFLPCAPSIRRQDRFDLVSSDEPDLPFWRILTSILTGSLDSPAEPASIIDVLETISVTLHGQSNTGYAFLRQFLQDYLDVSTTRSTRFSTLIWPGIVHLALELPTLFQDSCIPFSQGHGPDRIILSRRQVACLVIHQFLCSLPAHPWQTESFIDLSPWYSTGGSMHPGAVKAYLTALFAYFEAIFLPSPNGVIIQYSVDDWPLIFTLNTITDEEAQALLSKTSAPPFSRLEVVELPHHSTEPRYLGLAGGACVISANRCVGFGATGTQEEVQVGSCPEVYPVTLLTPPLGDRQVLTCQGAEAMVTVKGHGRQASLDRVLREGFQCTAADWQNRTMLFMDALELDLTESANLQSIPDLTPEFLYRELVKAYTAFSSSNYGPSRKTYSHICTGLWGCGAFGGNKQVKAIIQWCAASIAHVPELRYICAGPEQDKFANELKNFVSLVEKFPEKDLNPGKLFTVLVSLGHNIQEGKSVCPRPDGVFEYVLQSAT